MLRALGAREVHVHYRATDAMNDEDVAAARALLSSTELARFERFRFERDRRDYAAAHALLRTSLSGYADVAPRAWTFREEHGGKPVLDAAADLPPLSFNLSHTHGLVTCAIAAGADVGVDVESVDRRVDDGLARRFFSARENEDLARCDSAALRATRFFDLWTLKEAYLKAIGKGLSHPLDTVVFIVGAGDAVTFAPPPGIDAAAWQFRLFAPSSRHRLAVAVGTPDQAPVTIALLPGQ